MNDSREQVERGQKNDRDFVLGLKIFFFRNGVLEYLIQHLFHHFKNLPSAKSSWTDSWKKGKKPL